MQTLSETKEIIKQQYLWSYTIPNYIIHVLVGVGSVGTLSTC